MECAFIIHSSGPGNVYTVPYTSNLLLPCPTSMPPPLHWIVKRRIQLCYQRKTHLPVNSLHTPCFNPFMPAAAKRAWLFWQYFCDHSISPNIFVGKMFIRTQPMSLLQNFFEFLICSKVIFKKHLRSRRHSPLRAPVFFITSLHFSLDDVALFLPLSFLCGYHLHHLLFLYVSVLQLNMNMKNINDYVSQ